MLFRILEDNMPKFKKALQRIENKCIRFDCPFHYEEVGEEFEEVDEKTTLKYIVVDVEGIAQVNGWQLIAVLEHTEAGNVIHKLNLDIEVPERFYNTKPFCEHCNINRFRKRTYIIHNEENDDWKQVGGSCLNDFTGNRNAEWLASYYSYWDKLIEIEAAEPTGGNRRYVEALEIMAYTVAITRKTGYCKSGTDNATGRLVQDFYQHKHGGTGIKEIDTYICNRIKELNIVVEDVDEATATACIEYLKNMDVVGNYTHNVKTLANCEYIEVGNINLFVSGICCYNRNLERKEKEERRKKDNAKSQHVGTVGEKITATVQSWKLLTSFTNCFNGWDEVTTFMYQFVDDDDNVLIWKTQKHIDEAEEIITISGKVKKHNDYHGLKQTELTRCKIG